MYIVSSASVLIQNSGKIVTLCKLNVNVYRNYEFLPRKTRTLEPRRLLIRSKLWIMNRFNCSETIYWTHEAEHRRKKYNIQRIFFISHKSLQTNFIHRNCKHANSSSRKLLLLQFTTFSSKSSENCNT